MIGNVPGWILSGLIAAAGGFGLYLGSQPPAVSQPSGVFPNLLSKVSLPIDPKAAAPAPMNGDCDAGEKYRAAITEYLSNRPQYDKWYANANLAASARPHAVELLVEAWNCSRMNLFRKAPSEVITYDAEPASMDAIERLGQMAVQRGMLLRKT